MRTTDPPILPDVPAEDALVGATAGPTTSGSPGSPPVLGMILLLGTLAAMGPLAIDMYLPAFPTVAADLGVPESTMQRTLASYFVGLAVGQLIYGPAADRWGRKRPLYVGLTLFGLASLGCGLARSVNGLVLLRLLQATGGCAEMVVARAIVRDRFGPRDAVRVFSGLVLVMGVAPIVAPLTGGWIVGHFGWRAIFDALAGASAVMLVVVTLFFRESLPPDRRSRQSAGGIARVYGSLLRDRPFMAYAVATGLVSGGLFAYVGGSPLVFISIFGISKEHFGWFFGANAAGLIGMAQVNGWLVHRGHDPRKLLRGSLCVSAVGGLAMVAVAVTGAGGFWAMYATIFACIASCGVFFPNATALAMAPHGRHAGNASALLGFVQFSLSAVGGFAGSAAGATTAIPMAATIAGCAIGALVIDALAGRTEGIEARAEN